MTIEWVVRRRISRSAGVSAAAVRYQRSCRAGAALAWRVDPDFAPLNPGYSLLQPARCGFAAPAGRICPRGVQYDGIWMASAGPASQRRLI